MPKTKRRKINKLSQDYLNYRKKFYEEKKIGNIKNGRRVFSKYQFREAKKYGFTGRDILDMQTILKTKKQKKDVWKQYKKVRSNYERGDVIYSEKSIFGGEQEFESELTYHYNLSGLLKDRNTYHLLISARINDGEEREKVLADYGY